MFPQENLFGNSASSFAFAPDGHTMIVQDSKGNLLIWDIGAWKESKRVPPPADKHYDSPTFSGDGKLLAVYADKRSIRLLETTKWAEIKEIDGTNELRLSIGRVQQSHDGKMLAVGKADTEIWMWNNEQSKTQPILKGHVSTIRVYNFSPDGRLLVSESCEYGSVDRPKQYPAELKFWDVATGKEIFSHSGKQGWIYDIVFSPDSKLVAIAALGGTVRIWDVILRRELATLPKSEKGGLKEAVAFSSDGKWVLTAGFDGNIKAWDVTTGRLEKTVASGYDIIRNANFSPDGRSVLLHSNTEMKLLMLTVPEK